MAFLEHSISLDQLPVSESSFDPLPAGWYQSKITGAELKNTKSGSGQYIAVKYDILGPTHQGRVVFGNLNIRNQNQKAEEIGLQQLGDLMRAIGLSRVDDTDQLIGGVLNIKLSVKDALGDYSASNEVKGFKSAGGAAPQGQIQKPQNSQQGGGQANPQSASSVPPWMK